MKNHCCQEMEEFLKEKKVQIRYFPEDREYGIQLTSLNGSQNIAFCPWCGSKLPETLSDKRFELLENIIPDLDGIFDERIPQEFKTDEWWKKRGL